MPGDTFTTITSEGGLLPPDLLARVTEGDSELPGLSADDYHLGGGERLRERISRSWNRLLGVWTSYTDARQQLPEDDRGTTLTREKWLLPLFEELNYGRLQTTNSIEVDATDYPVSHLWSPTPIHLISFRYDLDTRTEGVAGAARWSPHAMVQELLNRTDDYLWAFLSNGRRLRVLRDSAALARQAYLEFDLEAMFESQVYADFVALWLTCHQSRVEADRPALCWLERWTEAVEKAGTRALDDLRDGVEGALGQLGSGFLSHPANTQLRDALASGELTTQDYYRELLRVVYRLLFLFVAEDRDLLLDPDVKPHIRDRYLDNYSSRRLRNLARDIPGTRHDDLWHTHGLVVRALGSDEGLPELALPPLGGQLFADSATPHLADTKLRNEDFLEAIRSLAWMEQARVVRAVDYRRLGAEELGSVYESLLELHPSVSGDYRRFALEVAPGSERKTTGSYYTPASLIEQLLDTALDPVIDQAANQNDSEQALLSLTVVDPACGSGHFLVAAAKRIARRLATLRTGDGEPSPGALKEAMREVVPRCIHGVDVNPMALELAKVGLWLEAHVPGQPLSFLDHHLRVGNSVLGATPALIARGIPDDAFKSLEGDEKKAVKEQRKRNRKLRSQMQTGTRQRTFVDLAAEEGVDYVTAVTEQAQQLEELPDDSVEALHAKEQAHADFKNSPELARQRRLGDAWCAAFTVPKIEGYGTEEPFEVFYRLRQEPDTTGRAAEQVDREAEEYRFFHWHLEFPHIFEPDLDPDDEDNPTGWEGGFDAVIGNPPWERVKLQEKEFFATRDEEIASAPNKAARRELIDELHEADDPLYDEFVRAKHRAEAASHMLRDSGRYPLCGVGDINTYQVFAELNRQNIAPTGRAGFIVPTGIATDYYTREFFGDLVETGTIAGLFDFENRQGIFPDVDSRMKFCLLTLTGGARIDEPGFAFFAHEVADLEDPERRFTLTPEDIALINPNTKTAPVFRTRRDAEIAAKIYNNIPVLIREDDPEGNPWALNFTTMFHMSNDSGLFRAREQLEADGWTLDGNIFVKNGEHYLPLYEGRFGHQFNHRFAEEPEGSLRELSLPERESPIRQIEPHYWVHESQVRERLSTRIGSEPNVLLGFRRVSRSTDKRTCIACVLPPLGVSYGFILSLGPDPQSLLILAAVYNSFVFDYALRLSLSQPSIPQSTFEQCPCPSPQQLDRWQDFLIERSLELTATEYQLSQCLETQPFRFDIGRRELMRAEIDGVLFHLYGLNRDEVDYVMETFPIVRRKDEEEHGKYRTKQLIIEIYDAIAKASERDEPYETRLDPPPGYPSLQHEPIDEGSRHG